MAEANSAMGPNHLKIVRETASTSPSFEQLLQITPLPPPGPLHYAARRKLWLTPPSTPPVPTESSPLKRKLEELLSRPDAVESEEVWKAGIEKVWKGLVAGGKLKKRLPMGTVIKVIHAGWLRDPETWPPGAVAPEPDDVLENESLIPATLVPLPPWTSVIAPDPSSGATPSFTTPKLSVMNGQARQ